VEDYEETMEKHKETFKQLETKNLRSKQETKKAGIDLRSLENTM